MLYKKAERFQELVKARRAGKMQGLGGPEAGGGGHALVCIWGAVGTSVWLGKHRGRMRTSNTHSFWSSRRVLSLKRVRWRVFRLAARSRFSDIGSLVNRKRDVIKEIPTQAHGQETAEHRRRAS